MFLRKETILISTIRAILIATPVAMVLILARGLSGMGIILFLLSFVVLVLILAAISDIAKHISSST